MEIPDEVALVVVKFLDYSLEPVEYNYDDLTPQEKALCTKEDFEAMVKWMRNE